MTTISTLCVFCGSRRGDDPAFAEAGECLGTEMAKRGVRLVYGGGDIGVMSVTTRAVLAGGGEVTGIIPRFLQEFEVGDPGIQELIVTESMHERKRIMFERSDGFVVLPGGLGTLDEMIEMTTWKQLRQHSKPIVLVNVAGYWAPYLALVDQVVNSGFGHAKIRDLFTVVDDVDDVFDALSAAPEPDDVVLTSHL